jgi:hypothetical protein
MLEVIGYFHDIMLKYKDNFTFFTFLHKRENILCSLRREIIL